MFINENKVAALEYIFYQKNEANIHKLSKKKVSFEQHPLGIDDYLNGEDQINSAFKAEPVAYIGDEESYLEEGHMASGLMECEGNSEQLVEAMISIWIINAHGQIFKKQEVSFHHHTKL